MGVDIVKPVVRKLIDSMPKHVWEDIYQSSLKKRTGVSLKYMMSFKALRSENNMISSAQFLHKELPIRFAHRIAELDHLPAGLSDMPPVLKVRDWYVQSFMDLRNFPQVRTRADEGEFTQLISRIRQRHDNTVPTMALGIAQLKKQLEADQPWSEYPDYPEIHQFLDRFFMSRIGIRMLIGQHVALHEEPPAGYVGLIHTRCSPLQIAQKAIADARALCARTYGKAPHVLVFGDPDFSFAYVPHHLQHMLFELLKNSLRAVEERYAGAPEGAVPPIRVVVADGEEDVTIKVSDEGGGITRSGMPRIWTYLYTTASSPTNDEAAKENEGGNPPVMLAGWGYGLPMSRLYAKYFGGDLQIISMETYGTDAYLHLNRLGNVQEPLP